MEEKRSERFGDKGDHSREINVKRGRLWGENPLNDIRSVTVRVKRERTSPPQMWFRRGGKGTSKSGEAVKAYEKKFTKRSVLREVVWSVTPCLSQAQTWGTEEEKLDSLSIWRGGEADCDGKHLREKKGGLRPVGWPDAVVISAFGKKLENSLETTKRDEDNIS